MVEPAEVQRITRTAGDVVRARKALADTLERRNRAIVDAADKQVQIRTIARAADMSVGGVVKVLATPHAWLE